LISARAVAARPARGWLRAVREAIGITQGRVAMKAAIMRQSYAQFELAEERGSISLASLGRAAAAMDCDLVYYLVPREAVASSYAGLAALHDPAAIHLKATDQSIDLGESAAGPAEERQ
jgi:transcriptional regulator with XRE-family HTH domain